MCIPYCCRSKSCSVRYNVDGMGLTKGDADYYRDTKSAGNIY